MKQWIKRIGALGFLSMSVFGGVATGANCERPCWYAYQRCVGLGNDQNQRFQAYLDCVDSCNGTP
jgi:hypothetical protein